MPRRKRVYAKRFGPDFKFGSLLLGKFINNLIKNGKRSIAEKIVYDSFDLIHEKTQKGGLNIFEQALKNVAPLVELKSRRVGGANYQVPVPVLGERRTTLAIRWVMNAAKGRKGKRMALRLAEELVDASNRTGGAVKKRDEVHRMAEANKAFAHFA